MSIFLGVDGGGTKTACVIGDETRVLASARGGGSNVVRSGEVQARAALHEAIRKVCAAASMPVSAINYACIGAAGAGRAEIADFVSRACAEVVGCKVQVVGDMVIAMHAAFGAGPGVIAIAGTGSIAYGRNAQGVTARAGGWGFVLGDEGSAPWIGRSAIRRALAALDEGSAPALLASILKAWPVNSVDELVLAGNAMPQPDFARLLQVVLTQADAGDAIAREVLEHAGTEVGSLARTVLQRLFPDSEHSVPVAMVGGVFRQSALVRQVFYNEVRAAFPQACVNPTVVEPMLGALDLARQQARA